MECSKIMSDGLKQQKKEKTKLKLKKIGSLVSFGLILFIFFSGEKEKNRGYRGDYKYPIFSIQSSHIFDELA